MVIEEKKMINNLKTGNPILRRVLITLLIFSGMTVQLAAQPTWSGNASVDPTEFVNFVDSIPLAGASSSFTRNTVVVVTNPQNNKSVEVTIVKRAPRPGVFLVLSEEAGMLLSLPSDQVIPVQVQVASNDTDSGYDEFKSVDPDINPAVTVPDDGPLSDETSETVEITEVPEEAVPEEAEEFSEVPRLSYDDPLPVPVPADDLRLDRGESSETAAVTDSPVEPELNDIPEDEESPYLLPPEEDIPLLAEETVTVEGSESTEAEGAGEMGDTVLPAGDNVIYFLTPSDFRPPSQPAIASEERDEIVPVLVDRETLEGYIVNNLKNGSSYIQLGAYSSAESIYSEIEAIEARYPMVVWTEMRKGETLYKLLIGPLTQDETGVLSYRFRDSGYADLFLYKP